MNYEILYQLIQFYGWKTVVKQTGNATQLQKNHGVVKYMITLDWEGKLCYSNRYKDDDTEELLVKNGFTTKII